MRHVEIGMGGPMALRVGGAMATYILLAASSIYGLKLALPPLSG